MRNALRQIYMCFELNWIVVTRKRNKVNLQVPSNTPMSKRPTDMAEFESRHAAAFSAADR